MGRIPRAGRMALLTPLAALGIAAVAAASPGAAVAASTLTGDLRATAIPAKPPAKRVTPAITEPASLQRVSGKMGFKAVWPVVKNVAKAELVFDGEIVDRITPARGTFAGATGYVNLAREELGRATFSVRLTYRDGDTASARRTVTVVKPPPADTTGPLLALLSPAAGATLSGDAAIAAAASDPSGVDEVRFLVDGELVHTDATAPYGIEVDTAEYDDGAYTLTARAIDTKGNDTSVSRNVMLSNHVPTAPEVEEPTAPPAEEPDPVIPEPDPEPAPPPTLPVPPVPTVPTIPTPTIPAGAASIPGRITHAATYESTSVFRGIQRVATDRIQLVGSPVAEGTRSGRFEVRQGDVWQGSTGNRAEVTLATDEREGQERWYTWRTMFPADYPRNSSAWQLFTQWHAPVGGTQAMIKFFAQNDSIGFTTVESNANKSVTSNITHWTAPMARGTWHTFKLRVKSSATRANGYVELWHNGVQVVNRTPAATIIPGYGTGNYVKQGLYRTSAISQTGVVYHDDWRVSIVE